LAPQNISTADRLNAVKFRKSFLPYSLTPF